MDTNLSKVMKSLSKEADSRNEPKNLKLLAAQCVLLASKVSDVSRVFPAEVVYQVKGWGREEFEILKDGAIEEYLLGIFDFNLILLTPADFMGFMLKNWDAVRPVFNCQRTNQEILSHLNDSGNRKTLELYAHQFCDLIL